MCFTGVMPSETEQSEHLSVSFQILQMKTAVNLLEPNLIVMENLLCPEMHGSL